jgi:hypothetical protein
MAIITDVVAGILRPFAEVVDHLTLSGEDKAKLLLAQAQGQINAAAAVMDYEKQLLVGQQAVIQAEASSSNWLASSWRPLTMLTFLALVVADSFRWLPSPLAPQAWNLLQIGLGGYTVGRSVEKVALPVARAMMGAMNGKP